MRVAFVGASTLAVSTARALIRNGHEVVVIDRDPERIAELAEELDCGLVTGDGSRPGVLAEIGPHKTDFLFAMSNRDEANIVAALVGRSLGFGRVVPKIEDPELEPICTELGLDDAIVPDREVARRLVDVVEGRDIPEFATVVRSGLRFVGFKVPAGIDDAAGLDLPDGALLIARTRGEDSVLATPDMKLEAGDEMVLIVEERAVEVLHERFASGRDTPKD